VHGAKRFTLPPANNTMSAISRFLLMNGCFLLLVGFVMYLKPSVLLSLTHRSVESLHRETLSVLSGWGAALVALSLIAIQMSWLSDENLSPKRYVARSLCVGWVAIAHGTWHMIGVSFFGNWNERVMMFLFLMESLLAAVSAFFGFLYFHKAKSP
jgi:hypothetical protein